MNEKATVSNGLEEEYPVVVAQSETPVNASGHRDQLSRQYGLLSICGLALTIDNAWVAFAGSLVVAIANGGPPGVLYELLIACLYYAFIASSLAELASSIPSSGGVYHWATITSGPKWGRLIGYYAGWLNFFGWIFDLAAIANIASNVAVQMYYVYHPDLTIKTWHLYVAYVIITWSCCFILIFLNRIIPYIQHAGLFLVIGGGLITIIVVAAMPSRHASSSFVWSDWENVTGWPSGVAFLTGVLNGAFTIGTPDSVTHMAEELPSPRTDIPKAIFAQISLGTLTSFLYAVAIFYSISDLGAVLDSSGSFPIAAVYYQATGSRAATVGLLLIILLSTLVCVIGNFLAVGRTLWSLGRDGASPFPKTLSRVNERLSCPIPATIVCSVLATGFGAIPFGSPVAFTDLAGSFIILTTTSYALAIAPHLFTGRRNVPKGPFWMGKKKGTVVNAVTITLICFFNVVFCLPYGQPVTVGGMNYNSVILVGLVTLVTIWWLVHAMWHYPGPKLSGLYIEGVVVTDQLVEDMLKKERTEDR